MPVTIARNSFARHDVVRELVSPQYRKSCDWCGNRPGRFRYGHATDGGRGGFFKGSFCCKTCCEAYNDTKVE